MTRARRLLWPTLVALVFALTFVTGRSAGPATERHERTLEALRTLTLSDSALQRDVLRARAGLLTSYDPIVEAVADLRGAALALRGAASDATGATRAELERRVADVAAGVDRQESNVETFKSQYAVLRNSLAYFSHLSGMTAGPQVDELASAMLRFTAGEGPDAASEVAAELERRSRSSGPGDPLIAHGRLLVETLPRVDLLVEDILDAPIAQRVQAVQETYLSEYARATARADAYRVLLYAAALALVGYLGRLFFRLRATARNLRVRVALEGLIAEISAAFVDVPGDDVGAGIEAGLARLGGHIRADRASFVVGGATERAFAWRRTESGSPALSPEDILALAGSGRGTTRADGRAQVIETAALPDGPEKSRLRRSGIATWLCISTQLDEGAQALLTFDTFREREWLDDDVALFRTAAEIFFNAIGRERGQADRAALQERLAHAQRLEAVGTLAGGIAHEFNNILGVILAATELALPSARGTVRRRLEQIATAAERAQRVVDQVLAFSRRRERELRTLPVQPVVAEAVCHAGNDRKRARRRPEHRASRSADRVDDRLPRCDPDEPPRRRPRGADKAAALDHAGRVPRPASFRRRPRAAVARRVADGPGSPAGTPARRQVSYERKTCRRVIGAQRTNPRLPSVGNGRAHRPSGIP